MITNRSWQGVALATTLAIVFTVLSPDPAAAVPAPTSMAATGDSITRAFNACTFPLIDCPQRSWATGSASAVNSHAARLGITGAAFNNAVSGAKMANLNAQMQRTVSQEVDYVVVLMGANDLCTSSLASQTPVATFSAQFKTAMDTVTAGLPKAVVYVVSIPDIHILWEILHSNFFARSVWTIFGICEALLANPGSVAAADVQRRAAFRAHNVALNQALEGVCAQYKRCHWDGWNGFNTPYQPIHISTRDFFHPSVTGQAYIAAQTWAVSPVAKGPGQN